MATAPPHRDPFDDVRDAFADLGTSAKVAFVIEATFETISEALAETGRRAASALDDLDIDSWFDAEAEPEMGAPPPPPPAPPPPVRKRAKPPTAKKTAGKAAPKRKPPKNDDDAA